MVILVHLWTYVSMKTLHRDQNNHKIREAYNKVTWYYDVWSRLTEQKAIVVGIRWANIKNGEQLLDVGCGTGRLLEQIISSNPDGSNIGIDLSPAMLAKARKRLTDQQGNYSLMVSNLLEWSGNNHTFDLIFNYYMVDLMPEKAFGSVVTKFYQLLRPGGRLVMGTFAMGTSTAHRFWYWMAKNFPKLLTYCRPVDFTPHLEEAGFRIEKRKQVVQNTFPSEVILAKKMVD